MRGLIKGGQVSCGSLQRLYCSPTEKEKHKGGTVQTSTLSSTLPVVLCVEGNKKYEKKNKTMQNTKERLVALTLTQCRSRQEVWTRLVLLRRFKSGGRVFK